MIDNEKLCSWHKDRIKECKLRIRFANGDLQTSCDITKKFIKSAWVHYRNIEDYTEKILSSFKVDIPVSVIVKKWEEKIIKS